MKEIIVIAHNIRSAHNVGSLLRTTEGLGVSKVCLTGYTPYPLMQNDPRLPHEARKVDARIAKTALGADKTQDWSAGEDINKVIDELRSLGYVIAALEQTKSALSLPDFSPPEKIALIIGRETEGIETEVLGMCDIELEIPMHGKKESYNVVQATAMALYHLTFSKHKR